MRLKKIHLSLQGKEICFPHELEIFQQSAVKDWASPFSQGFTVWATPTGRPRLGDPVLIFWSAAVAVLFHPSSHSKNYCFKRRKQGQEVRAGGLPEKRGRECSWGEAFFWSAGDPVAFFCRQPTLIFFCGNDKKVCLGRIGPPKRGRSALWLVRLVNAGCVS